MNLYSLISYPLSPWIKNNIDYMVKTATATAVKQFIFIPSDTDFKVHLFILSNKELLFNHNWTCQISGHTLQEKNISLQMTLQQTLNPLREEILNLPVNLMDNVTICLQAIEGISIPYAMSLNSWLGIARTGSDGGGSFFNDKQEAQEYLNRHLVSIGIPMEHIPTVV